MPDSTSVRQIKVGRIVGLSAYEIAVKNGTFTGTEQDFAKNVIANYTELNNIKEQLTTNLKTINETLTQLQEKITKINQQLPENISISTNATNDDIIFNVK